MDYCFITFRSVTPAQRAESILHHAGIECYLQRTPRWMEEQGCGYSLRLRYAYAAEAHFVLKEHSISYRKIYLRRENGSFEELRL